MAGARTAGYVRVSAEELGLIQEVRKAEDFRRTAWATYGRAWDQHLPQTVNAFVHYYFGTILFPEYLAVYYAPQDITSITVIGARGSGKTENLALAWATLQVINPGYNHLHVALTKDQADLTIAAILKWGVNGFTKTFIQDVVHQPFPEIRFKRWDELDTGSVMLVRSFGDEGVEKLRSHTAGIVSGDELFREVQTGDMAAQLRGCIRGINQYRLKQLPKEVQNRYQGLLRGISLTFRPDKRAELQQELDRLIYDHSLGVRGLLCLYGNPGLPDWAWERLDRRESDPQHYWGLTVKSSDNPTKTQAELDAMARDYGDNDELRAVEMEAKRPTNLGKEFPAGLIRACTDPDAGDIKEVEANFLRGVPGYLLGRHAAYGVYLYARPAQVDEHLGPHRHVLGADPGTGALPGRNKWVIVAFDVSAVPCRLVYFEMGYLGKGTGHYAGFLARLKQAALLYPCAAQDIVVESTGPQKGMTELAWPEDLPVNAIDFTSAKPRLLNYLRQLMGKQLVSWPRIERILQELGNYDLPDTLLSQDVVMALICAAERLWAYHGFKEQPLDDRRPRPAQVFNRQTRLAGARPRRAP